MDDAKPAPAGGQPWAKALTKAGDKHCIANQKLRLQTQDALELQRAEPVPHAVAVRPPLARRVGEARSRCRRSWSASSRTSRPAATSPRASAYLNGNKNVWHLAPERRARRLARPEHDHPLGRVPEPLRGRTRSRVIPDSVLSLSGALYSFLADAGAAPVEQSRFAGMTDVAAAKAIFEKDPRVRLLMDNGAGPQGPGSIGASWELGFGAWPPAQAKADARTSSARAARSAPKPGQGGLGPLHRRPEGAARARRCRVTAPSDAWKAQPPYNWAPVAAGKGLGFVTTRAGQGRRDRRPLEPRRVRQVVGQATPTSRSRSPRSGPTATRPTSRTAGCAPRTASSTRKRSTALDPVPDAPEAGRGAAARRARSRSSACRSSRWRTRSARARGSG